MKWYMSRLPPIESAYLETSHLVMAHDQGVAGGTAGAGAPISSVLSGDNSSRYVDKSPSQRARWRLPVAPALLGVLFAAIAVPAALLYAAQPHQPNMSQDQQQQMAMYIDENNQQQGNLVAANQGADGNQEYTDATLTGAENAIDETPLLTDANASDGAMGEGIGPIVDADLTTQAELASSASNVKNKTYAYHLTLAQGFLKKAIDLSQNSQGAQSEGQKAEIKKYLDQSLESANKAIESDAREGSGFLVRARIYKTGAVLDPTLTELSDQDLQIARALGIDSNYLTEGQDVYDLLPTQQATDLAGAPIIADPESGNDSTVATETNDNSQTGTIIMPTGKTEITVNLPSLTAGQSIQVNSTPDQDTAGATYMVKSQEVGTGFTIQSSQAVDHDVMIEWRVISE